MLRSLMYPQLVVRSQALQFLASIGIVIFTIDLTVLIALESSNLSETALFRGLMDAALLTLISAPILYSTSVRPFVDRARGAEKDLKVALRARDDQARELSTALAQQNAHKLVLDRHAIVSETDLEGRITYVNDLFVQTTGYSREECYGQNYRILNADVHPPEFWNDMFATMLSGNIWQGDVCNKRKDGSLYWVQATNSAVRDKNDHITGFVSVRIDISEAKRREQALKSTQEQLQQERAKAEAASVSKSNFLSTMSHEMRTPLNGVLGALDLLRDTGLDEKQAALVNIAHESGDALLVHINDVLDFSKMEAGKLDLEPKPFHLNRLVSSVLHIVAPQAEQRGNKLSSTFTGELPVQLDGDRIRVRQVLLNLVSNANKFTKGGSINVEVTRIGGDTDRPEIEIGVSDTGIGIPKDRLKDLFQEFSMLDSSFTRKTSGTGLGLAISKRLIEAMGGTISVDSVLGQGSRFWFRIALPALWNAGAPEEEQAGKPLTVVPRLKILLADDNVTNQIVASRMLAEAGHTVVTVSNGREAVDAAKLERFDVILTDISMPEMDGIEATKLIRRLPEPYCRVPIVALTANAISGDRERFLAAGMNEYLTKPIRRTNLEACLASIFAVFVKTVPEIPASSSELQLPLIDPAELQRLAEEASPEIVPVVVNEYVSEMRRRLDEALVAMNERNIDRLEKVTHAIAGASAATGALKLRDLSKKIEIECSCGDHNQALVRANDLPVVVAETERVFQHYLSALPKTAA